MILIQLAMVGISPTTVSLCTPSLPINLIVNLWLLINNHENHELFIIIYHYLPLLTATETIGWLVNIDPGYAASIVKSPDLATRLYLFSTRGAEVQCRGARRHLDVRSSPLDLHMALSMSMVVL